MSLLPMCQMEPELGTPRLCEHFVGLKSHALASSAFLCSFGTPGRKVEVSLPYFFLLFDKVIITSHKRNTPGLDTALNRVLNDIRFVPHVSWVMFSVLDCFSDVLQGYVLCESEECDRIDDAALDLPAEDYCSFVTQMKQTRKNLGEIRRIIMPKVRLVTHLVTHHKKLLHPDVTLYLRDMLEHLKSNTERVDVLQDLLSQAQSNFHSCTQWKLNQTHQSVDYRMRILTAIDIAFLPLVAITGLWGLNTEVPGQHYDGLEWFWLMTAAMLAMLLSIFLHLVPLIRAPHKSR